MATYFIMTRWAPFIASAADVLLVPPGLMVTKRMAGREPAAGPGAVVQGEHAVAAGGPIHVQQGGVLGWWARSLRVESS
jgi:hypothetical protein